MKNINYIKTVLFAVIFTFLGCQEEEYSFGDIVAPTNIIITADIVGADAANPNGDGSGVVNFTATANNAVSYKYLFNGVETVSLSGNNSISFSSLGVNTYTVTVIASGTAGVSSSKSIEVVVLSTYAPPTDLLAKLYGYDLADPNALTSRTWKIHATKRAHFGVGPPGATYAEYYEASPNDKEGVGMYDDRITFSSDGTFTHVTNGTILGRNPFVIDDLGPNTTGFPNGDDIENYPYPDYTSSFSLTAPGGVEKINLSGIGFIGYYTGGSHDYEILDRQVPNELELRTVDASGGLEWYFIITLE